MNKMWWYARMTETKDGMQFEPVLIEITHLEGSSEDGERYGLIPGELGSSPREALEAAVESWRKRVSTDEDRLRRAQRDLWNAEKALADFEREERDEPSNSGSNYT